MCTPLKNKAVYVYSPYLSTHMCIALNFPKPRMYTPYEKVAYVHSTRSSGKARKNAGRLSNFRCEIENLMIRCKNRVLYISLSG